MLPCLVSRSTKDPRSPACARISGTVEKRAASLTAIRGPARGCLGPRGQSTGTGPLGCDREHSPPPPARWSVNSLGARVELEPPGAGRPGTARPRLGGRRRCAGRPRLY